MTEVLYLCDYGLSWTGGVCEGLLLITPELHPLSSHYTGDHWSLTPETQLSDADLITLIIISHHWSSLLSSSLSSQLSSQLSWSWSVVSWVSQLVFTSIIQEEGSKWLVCSWEQFQESSSCASPATLESVLPLETSTGDTTHDTIIMHFMTQAQSTIVFLLNSLNFAGFCHELDCPLYHVTSTLDHSN